MSSPVQLYVYDLSNGLARQLSRQLTGRQIDGIWHTSIVVFGREIFYGQGICITQPGRSHHGNPLQVVDMGQTALDEETFDDYLAEMREQYTADKYHLLDFNCNSFTNDCVGFLTGSSIPSWIKDLPSDFLSTPFGAALRPTIDNMFRRGAPGGSGPIPAAQAPSAAAAAQASPNPQLAASLLEAFAERATQPVPALTSNSLPAMAATSTLSAPMQICTNPASFSSLLKTHRVLVAFFTSANCGPCKMIEPTFESLARDKTQGRTGKNLPAFVKIDLGVGMGVKVGGEYGVRATPTFIFFLDGQKMHELRGANAAELQTQVDLLLYQAFPPHPHTKLSLPAVEALSLNPILFTQVPALEAVFAKFVTFVDGAAVSTPTGFNNYEINAMLTSRILPYLQGRAALISGKVKTAPGAHPDMLTGWARNTAVLASALPMAQLFPLIDMWRLALLDPAVTTILSSLSPAHNPVFLLLGRAQKALGESTSNGVSTIRNTVLTALRMLSNALGVDTLARMLCGAPDARARMMDVLVPCLLHEDAAVRTAAASAAFNVAAFLQRGRVDQVRSGRSDAVGSELEGDWEVEMVSAVVEAIGRETTSEDVVHRLTASLAFLLRLSPMYNDDLAPLLEVLQARDTVNSKLSKGQCGENGAQKKDVKALVSEVASKLCR